MRKHLSKLPRGGPMPHHLKGSPRSIWYSHQSVSYSIQAKFHPPKPNQNYENDKVFATPCEVLVKLSSWIHDKMLSACILLPFQRAGSPCLHLRQEERELIFSCSCIFCQCLCQNAKRKNQESCRNQQECYWADWHWKDLITTLAARDYWSARFAGKWEPAGRQHHSAA